jgi:hypothetical protein
MAIKPKSMKVLWAYAAGRCSFPGRQARLCSDEAGHSAPYTIGEMAHICAEKPGFSRYDSSQTPDERDGYPNLILLCPTHHTLIDKPENEKRYNVSVLQKMKADHEGYVSARLEVRKFQDKRGVAKCVYPLLKQNHDVFLAYGPHSEIVKKNPESDAHAIWLSERLATIVPNNRKIAEIVTANSDLFTPSEQAILNKYALHTRSYEAWVTDEVSYEGVVRFPEEFDKLISELTDAGT